MGRVLVLGNAAFDVVLTLPRLPLHGETLIASQATRAPGGKGLNQAVVAARAGIVPVHFCAPLGQDAAGDDVAAALAHENFARLDLPRLAGPTDMSTVMVLPDGENSIVSAGACAAAFPVAAATAFADRAGPGDWLLLQGNLSAAATHAAIRAAVARGAAVMLNTAPLCWPAAPMLPDCAVVVANRVEAVSLSGHAAPADAAAWLHEAGTQLAVVTLGAQGCVTAGCVTSGCVTASPGGLRHWPAAMVATLDSTGCGDAFCGRLAVALAAGAALDAAIAAAQRAAAIAAGRMGAFASLPTAADMQDGHRMGIST